MHLHILETKIGLWVNEEKYKLQIRDLRHFKSKFVTGIMIINISV
jgi:hypothetical protein